MPKKIRAQVNNKKGDGKNRKWDTFYSVKHNNERIYIWLSFKII